MSENKSIQREIVVIANGDDLETFRWSNQYKEIYNKVVGEWRHGSEKEQVMKRISDGKFFSLAYRTGPDGTGFSDNNWYPLEAIEVFPVTKTITVYE